MAVIMECKSPMLHLIRYDDVLTREIVESRKWTQCRIYTQRVVLELNSTTERSQSHQYPPVAPERLVPLMKLLISLRIPFGGGSDIKMIPQPWREGKTYKERREEALMASAARVLAYKAKMSVTAPADADIAREYVGDEDTTAADCY